MPRRLSDWLVSYLDYTSDHEAPEKIHLWTGLAVLSAAVKRQLYMERVFYNIFPNLYILIVAESARSRKSSAMKLGIPLLKDADKQAYIMKGRMTPEALVSCLNRTKTITDGEGHGEIHTDSFVLIHEDELATLFGYERQAASRMAMLLTELYDSPDYYPHMTITGGLWELYNNYITVIVATDPRNLKVLPEEAIAGLMGRMIIVVGGDRRHSRAWLDDAMKHRAGTKRAVLVGDLTHIAKLHGEMVPTPEAKKLFEEWYEAISSRQVTDARIEPFVARCHDTALKIAMLISISRTDSLKVEKEHIAGGIMLIEKLLPETERILSWTAATNFAQTRIKFVDFLRKRGGYANRQQALRNLEISAEDMDMLEATVVQEGTVERTLVNGRTLYRLRVDKAEDATASEGRLDSQI